MAKFCGKCGAKLDEKTGLCPNCDKNRKEKKKRNRLSKRGIIALVLVCVLVCSSVLGAFVVTFQPKPVVHDNTQDMGNGNGSDGTGGSEQGGGASSLNGTIGKTGNSNEAILSRNVKVFSGEDASKIGAAIGDLDVTNQGVYFDIGGDTPFDELGVGDIFYLEGSENSPLGQTYIGKIASISNQGEKTTYLIETPMVDEVFDVLDIDYDAVLTADDIQSIDTVEGVTVTTVDSVQDNFTLLSNTPSHTPVVSNLAYHGNSFSQSQLSSGQGKELLFNIDVDLLKVFGLTKQSTVGFDEYDYTEGYRIDVYITETGGKYHTEKCPCLYASSEKIALADAVNEGYEPCFICVPPVLKGENDTFDADASLKLEGKIGFESLEYNIDYDWDIMSGSGLERLDASAKGNFLAEIALKSQMEIEIGGATTTLSLPTDNIKFQGLKEKLFPIIFISYNGATLNVSSLFPGNDYIHAVTGPVPITVGAIIYADINGNLTVDASLSFAFNYAFDCSYTAIENGQWVNRWESEGEPSFQVGLNCEVSGDVDAHLGASVSLYVFNLNVAEIAVAKIGAEAEGKLVIEHKTDFHKVSDEWEATSKSSIDGSYYARIYLKILEINIKLKTRIKVWSLVDVSGSINYTYTWLDVTIAEWGKKNDTRYSESLMNFSAVTAQDETALYYKDTTGCLIKEQDNYKETLYKDEFFSICGIDSSYIYLTLPVDGKYEICRVSKNDGTHKVIAKDVATPLLIDEEHLYYVSDFDSTSIVRLNRGKLTENQFATFKDDVKFMGAQGDDFYVATKEGGIFAAFFGGSADCYLLNSSGDVICDYGSNPTIEQYYIREYGLFREAARMTSDGYLRGTASEIYWTNKDMSSTVLAEGISGWNAKDVGIFTTLKDDASGKNKIVLYRASDGSRVDVTDVSSDQAFFTLCQSGDGEWYFFDQTDSEMILYVMSSDFTNKTELKTFSLDTIHYNLSDCSMTLMNNRIYFYTMPDNQTSEVLYRYDII